MMPCRECDGKGRDFDPSHGCSRSCQTCDGTGQVASKGKATNPYRERAVDRIADIWGRLGVDESTEHVTVRRAEVEALLRVAEAALSVGTAPGSELDRAIGELGASRR